MFLFPIVFFCLSIYYYGRKDHAKVLFCLTLLLTNGFGIVPGDAYLPNKTDLLLLPTLYITYFEQKRHKGYFSVKGDAIGKCVFLILLFLLFEFGRSILMGIEQPAWAFKVIRMQFLLLIYFYLRRQSLIIWEKFIHWVLLGSVVQGILFYLQLVGVRGILGSDINDAVDNIRYANYPTFTPFFVLYFIVKPDITLLRRIGILAFWGGMLMLSQVRGVFVGLAGSFAMLLYLQRSRKNLIYLTIAVIVYFLFVAPMLQRRDNEKAGRGTGDDIELLMSSSIEEMAEVKGGQVGTVAFRLGMLAERWLYLVNNPEFMLLGVGCIHEQSPANRFMFYLGTDNEQFKYGQCMIESGDITWVPLLLRYGIVGVLVFASLLIVWIFYAWRNFFTRLNFVSKAACLMSVSTMLSSIGTTVFDNPRSLMVLCLFLGMTAVKVPLE